MRRERLVWMLLLASTLAVYWPVRHHAFVGYDDSGYVTENLHVQAGLSWAGLKWAFSSPVLGNWHPVTMLSHMLDCQLFGLNAGAHHLVSAAIHALNGVLLGLLLQRLTGAFWRSAAVAALFALHPLRVESVAWVSERKDVLSGFFFLLTLLAYAGYVARSEGRGGRIESSASRKKDYGQCGRRAGLWYGLALLLFTLGLMSKPMLVTVPCVLLLLDVWPLRRVEMSALGLSKLAASAPPRPDGRGTLAQAPGSGLRRLLGEKTPFFALSALFSVLTYYVQQSAGAVITSKFTFEERLSNAVVSYIRYLGKLFWPVDLAALYPHPASHYPVSDQWPTWQVWVAAGLLVLISVECLIQLRRRPYLAVGWCWFLGMLFPVIGLVQAGEQAMADRYTYLPLIGPVLSLVWLWGEWVTPKAAAASTPVALSHPPSPPRSTLSRSPLSRSTLHAPRSPLLGVSALLSFALLGACAGLTGRQVQYWRNTVALFEHAIAVTADNPSAHFGLAVGLEQAGQPAAALDHYRVALAVAPRLREALHDFARLLRKRGFLEMAAEQYRMAVQYYPRDLTCRLNYAGTLSDAGRRAEAVAQFEVALQIDPDNMEALNNLAWLLASSPEAAVRNGARAVQLAQRACELSHWNQTMMIGTLAAAYAEAGRFPEAVATAEKACACASRNGEANLLEKNQQLLALYKLGQPYREPSAPAESKSATATR